MTPFPEKYKTDNVLKFKDEKHFRKMKSLFSGIVLIGIMTAVYIGLKSNEPMWLIDAGVFLTFLCFIYALESLPVAIAANIVAGLSVLLALYNSLVLGESWSAFLLALSFEICFLCLMCFIYVYKALRDDEDV